MACSRPGALLVELAGAVDASADDLLRIEPRQKQLLAKTARIRERLQQVGGLPPADQKATLKFVDDVFESRGWVGAEGAKRSR